MPSVLFEMYFQEVFQQIMTGIVTLRSRLEKELFFFSRIFGSYVELKVGKKMKVTSVNRDVHACY